MANTGIQTASDFIGEQIHKALALDERPDIRYLRDLAAPLGFDDEQSLQPALVTLCGLFMPKRYRTAAEIAAYTGYDRSAVQLFINRLRWNGIWTEDGMRVTWPDDAVNTNDLEGTDVNECSVAFTCDALVASGILRRSSNDGKNIYITAERSGLPVFAGGEKFLGGQWSRYAVGQALQIQHRFSAEAASIIIHYGWLNDFKIEHSQRSMACWMRRCRNLPSIPVDVAAMWLAYYVDQCAAEALTGEPRT